MSKLNKRVLTHCKQCQEPKWRRSDMLVYWGGCCRSCAQTLAKSKPDVRRVLSFRARKQVLRQGGIPNACKFTPESVRKMGPDHWNWKGGISLYQRDGELQSRWSRRVMQKKGRVCLLCWEESKPVHVHHLKSWGQFPDLRYDIQNGIPLCFDCHLRYAHAGKFTVTSYLTDLEM